MINPRYQGPTALVEREHGCTTHAVRKKRGICPGATPDSHQAAFLVDPAVVNPGTPPYNGRYQVVVRGLDQFRAGGKSMGFPRR